MFKALSHLRRAQAALQQNTSVRPFTIMQNQQMRNNMMPPLSMVNAPKAFSKRALKKASLVTQDYQSNLQEIER